MVGEKACKKYVDVFFNFEGELLRLGRIILYKMKEQR